MAESKHAQEARLGSLLRPSGGCVSVCLTATPQCLTGSVVVNVSLSAMRTTAVKQAAQPKSGRGAKKLGGKKKRAAAAAAAAAASAAANE